jgi:hypothetical protein
MPFNVADFRSQFVADGARPNLFQVEMQFPPIFGAAGDSARKLTFMCKTAALPGSTIGTVELQYFGRQVKLAGNRTFADWTVTILNDEDFAVRKAFERWMGGINTHSTNLRLSGATGSTGYTTDPIVTQYGKSGNVIKSYKLIGAFPTDLAQIDLDWGSNDTVEEYTVTLSYQYWQTLGEGSPLTV